MSSPATVGQSVLTLGQVLSETVPERPTKVLTRVALILSFLQPDEEEGDGPEFILRSISMFRELGQTVETRQLVREYIASELDHHGGLDRGNEN